MLTIAHMTAGAPKVSPQAGGWKLPGVETHVLKSEEVAETTSYSTT